MDEARLGGRVLFAMTATLAALCVLLLVTEPPAPGHCVGVTPIALPALLVLGVLALVFAATWGWRLTVIAMVLVGMLPTVTYGIRHSGDLCATAAEQTSSVPPRD